MLHAIWYHLYSFRNVKNTHGGVLKITLLHECFSRFLNITKSRKMSPMRVAVLISRIAFDQ